MPLSWDLHNGGWLLATRVMEEVCGVKRLRPEVPVERLVQQLDYCVRFLCV
jgi:hypothetical protein